MKFEKDGITLWLGTESQPAPEDSLTLSEKPVEFAVRILPVSGSNQTYVLYSINGGEDQRLKGTWVRNDLKANVQFFKFTFPMFMSGSKVEYEVQAVSGGKRIASTKIKFEVVQQQKAQKDNPLLAQEEVVEGKYLAKGKIRKPLPTGTIPVVGVVVRCYRMNFKDKEGTLLGQSISDDNGNYQISYQVPEQKKIIPVHLQVRVYPNEKENKPVGISEVRFKVKEEETIDVLISQSFRTSHSGYKLLKASLLPFLENQAIKDLKEDRDNRDFTLLAGESGKNTKDIATLVHAHRLEAETGIEAEVFYGLAKQNLPLDLPTLLNKGLDSWSLALDRATESGEISTELADKKEEILDKLEKEQVKRIPKFLVQPQKLYAITSNLSKTKEPAGDYVRQRLNVHFRKEVASLVASPGEKLEEAVQSALEGIAYEGAEDENMIGFFQKKVIPILREQNPELQEEVRQLEERLTREGGNSDHIKEVLHLNRPLKKNPIFENDLQKAKILAYAQLAKVSEAKAAKLLKYNQKLENANDSFWSMLEGEGTLTNAERKDLQLTVELGKLTEDNLPFVEALKGYRQVKEAKKLDQALSSFASWRSEDFNEFMEKHRVTSPEGIPKEAYIDTMLSTIEKTFPAQVLTNRYQSENLKPFFKQNPNIDISTISLLGKGGLNWKEIDENQELAIKKELLTFQRVLRLGYTTEDRLKLLKSQLTSAEYILTHTRTSFAKKSEIDKPIADRIYRKAIEESERKTVLKENLRLMVNGDVNPRMIPNHRLDLLLPINSDTRYLLDKIAAVDNDTSDNGNVAKIVPYELIDPTTYEDLFGSLRYCDCEHCKSIFSPAAYFVDLMYFVEKFVSIPVFIEHEEQESRIDSPIYLKKRRPDLWDLQLSCENTNTEIPYLTLVNEVLESYLKKLHNKEIWQVLYWQETNEDKVSTFLPFNLPLEETRSYLKHFGISLFDIYWLLSEEIKQPIIKSVKAEIDASLNVFEKPKKKAGKNTNEKQKDKAKRDAIIWANEKTDEKIWRTKLNISSEELEVISKSNFGGINYRFGLRPLSTSPDTIVNFRVQSFIEKLGIDREQLSDLLDQQFNPDLKTVYIHSEFDIENLTNTEEVLKNLDIIRLDYIHRFIGLWRKTSWSIKELDLVLSTLLEARYTLIEISAQLVRLLAQLVYIQEKLNLKVDELCGIVGQIPNSKAYLEKDSYSKKPLFDRLFDISQLFGGYNSVAYYHYDLDTRNPEDIALDISTPALLRGLAISESDLLVLLNAFKEDFPFDKEGKTTLNRLNISKLYRHVRIAQALKWSIEEYLIALEILFGEVKPLRLLPKITVTSNDSGLRDRIKRVIYSNEYSVKLAQTDSVQFKEWMEKYPDGNPMNHQNTPNKAKSFNIEAFREWIEQIPILIDIEGWLDKVYDKYFYNLFNQDFTDLKIDTEKESINLWLEKAPYEPALKPLFKLIYKPQSSSIRPIIDERDNNRKYITWLLEAPLTFSFSRRATHLKEFSNSLETVAKGLLVNVLALIRFNEWQKKSPFSIAELEFILLENENNEVQYQYTPEKVTAMVLELQQSCDDQPIDNLSNILLPQLRDTIETPTTELLRQHFKDGSFIEYLSRHYLLEIDLHKEITNYIPVGIEGEVPPSENTKIEKFTKYLIAKFTNTEDNQTTQQLIILVENNDLKHHINNAFQNIPDRVEFYCYLVYHAFKLRDFWSSMLGSYPQIIKERTAIETQFNSLLMSDTFNNYLSTFNPPPFGIAVADITAIFQHSSINQFLEELINLMPLPFEEAAIAYNRIVTNGFVERLSNLFQLSTQGTLKLFDWTTTALDTNTSESSEVLSYQFNDDTLLNNLKASISAEDNGQNEIILADITHLMQQFERVRLIFDNLKIDEEDIIYLTDHNSVLGEEKLHKYSLDLLKGLIYYKNLVSRSDKIKNWTRTGLIEFQNQFKFLDYYRNPTTLSEDKKSLIRPLKTILSRIWKIEESLTDTLMRTLKLSGVSIKAFQYFEKCLETCQKLGINGYSLQKLLEDDSYDTLVQAREIAIGAFASKYPDVKTRQEKLEPFQDKINRLKCDVLCDYIIARQKELKFKDKSDLYAFFLLDVDMGACARTSRVVSAISSLQLYVHRILVNLEQTASGIEPPINVLHDMNNDDLEDFKQEWEWRKYYRVWEANRKVFLYPETYIEPDLRDNKSPEFKELEEELLQEKITMEAAETAYKKYLTQFAQLAKLQIAGSYYNKDGDDSQYYFFGRTYTDPYQYYYRTFRLKEDESKVGEWNPWVKIELNIEAAEVSAFIHLGKIHICWIQLDMKEIKNNNNPSSKTGHLCNVYFMYSVLKENGQWNTPQKSFVGYKFYSEAQIKSIIDKESEFEDKDNYLLPNFEKETKLSQLKRIIATKPYIRTKPYQELFYFSLIFPEAAYDREFIELPSMIEVNEIKLKEINISDSRIAREKRKSIDSGFKIDRVTIGNNPNFSIDGSVTNYITNTKIKLSDLPYSNVVRLNTNSRINFRHVVLLYSNTSLPVLGTITIFSKVEVFNPSIDLSNLQGNLIINNDLTGQIEGIINFKFNPPTIYEFVEYSIRFEIPLEIDSKPFQESDSFKYSICGINLIDNNKKSDITNIIIDRDVYIKKEAELRTQTNFDTAHYVQDGNLNYTSKNKYIKGSFPETKLYDNNNKIELNTNSPDQLVRELNLNGLLSFFAILTQRMIKSELNETYGHYYKELFFHIPFLIANHLNANKKFKEAKWWYERIFDPTANTKTNDSDNDRETDTTDNTRTWQYIEFKTDIFQSLSDVLRNWDAIERYKDDPFSPHAIARMRISAYQKAIVMKYIDNLLDWGDYLFSQDTRESINEAQMLYILASDILGMRPLKVGKCVTAGPSELTYEQLGPDIFSGTIEEDNVSAEIIFETLTNELLTDNFSSSNPGLKILTSNENIDIESASSNDGSNVVLGNYTFPFTSKKLAFCVPPNKDLLAYWDRVEDRLYKIRNCMNISGVRRSLSLFSPPIDPRFLVRAKAAGLSLDDIIRLITDQDNIPPYRFSFLLEKARQFTQTVQSFGSNLLSALEKKDAEELSLLRSTHERNILSLSENLKSHQIEEAKNQYHAMVETETNVQNRIDHYVALIDEGLIPWEIKQQITKHVANGLNASVAVYYALSAGLELIPKIIGMCSSSGGDESAKSAEKEGLSLEQILSALHGVSDSAGLEATFQRREEDWVFQKELADQEIKQVNQQKLAAEIRVAIAEKDLEIHQKTMEHAEELHQLYKDKFTNFGLYTYLSQTLNRLYREAYNQAQEIAKMAERAYQFETDDTTFFIRPDNWKPDKAGLLAGEQLLLQLQQIEQKYLDNHKRDIEITQSFSMRQIAPEKLLDLKVKGSCQYFTIPEAAFDLTYPGYYKRLIKSVRVTIPCVVGPYTNIGCTLSLTKAYVRITNSVNDAESLIERKPAGTAIIATSSGQNDGGQFELNFRDERYLPFEGNGAISTWSLDLPTEIRPFDYNTISDVIFHISYTAKYDFVLFKNQVNDNLKESLNQLSENGLQRLFSLRHDFPNEWHKFNKADPAEAFQAVIRKDYFPFWAQGMEMNLDKAKIFGIGIKNGQYQPVESEVENAFNPPKLDTENQEATLTIPLDAFKEKVDDIVVKDWLFAVVKYTVS